MIIGFVKICVIIKCIIIVLISTALTGSVNLESLFKTLKHEEVNLCEYETFEYVVARFPYFIDGVDNQNRLYSALGYRSPNDFERLPLIQQNNRVPRQTLLTLPVQS